jgi:aspartate/methionine/tyrosine aminotransferase
MKFETFDLERDQSLFENYVDYNLTESGVHPFTFRELLQPDELEQLLDTRLTYGQTNGSVELRQRIAALYDGADLDNVLVTNGSAEANMLAVLTCLQAGDEVAMMLPNYMQIWGLARAIGVKIKPFHLKEDLNWAPDMAELAEVITPKTKMIVICNPNNPTGAVLSHADMAEIVTLASRVGAWIYADEVYRGAELDGVETPTFYDLYDKVMVTGSLSKAYALPGLRLGWLTGPKGMIADGWSTHDYTSIAAGVISNYVAALALEPVRRAGILERNRSMLRQNLAILDTWAADKKELFSYVPPKAGGMAFMRYNFDINSTELTVNLRQQKSVFVVPGDSFGIDRFIRIGIGSEPDYFLRGLSLVDEYLKELL